MDWRNATKCPWMQVSLKRHQIVTKACPHAPYMTGRRSGATAYSGKRSDWRAASDLDP
jgi:hypothetical protein